MIGMAVITFNDSPSHCIMECGFCGEDIVAEFNDEHPICNRLVCFKKLDPKFVEELLFCNVELYLGG